MRGADVVRLQPSSVAFVRTTTSIVRVYARKRVSGGEKTIPNINRCLIKKRLRGRLRSLYDVYRKISYGDDQRYAVELFVKAVSIDERYHELYVDAGMSFLVYHRCLYMMDPYMKQGYIL